nr:hypothetical protein [Thermodesulfovibrio aggregans]
MAIIVGITALPITAAIRSEYWVWSIIPCVNPNNAEIEPNVRPVDIRSVVYIPSLCLNLKILVTG